MLQLSKNDRSVNRSSRFRDEMRRHRRYESVAVDQVIPGANRRDIHTMATYGHQDTDTCTAISLSDRTNVHAHNVYEDEIHLLCETVSGQPGMEQVVKNARNNQPGKKQGQGRTTH